MSDVSQVKLDEMAEQMHRAFGPDQEKAFLAAADAARGLMDPLNDMLGTDYTDFIEAQKGVQERFKDWEKSRTPLERMWSAIKTAASTAMHEMLADVNDVFGDNGIVGIIRGALNLIGARVW